MSDRIARVSPQILIRPMRAHEWATYRDLRLRALADAPEAFSRTYAEEKDRADAAWSQRLSEWVGSTSRLALVAIVDDEPAGLAFVQLEGGARDVAQVFSMWVAPTTRLLGIGARLVAVAIEWSREHGARKMRLQVTETNTAAMKLYQRAGFRPTAEVEPLREGSPLLARSMELIL